MSATRLFLLGLPRFERDGQPVSLPVAKGVALLGFLAATGQPQAREHLMALLWPDSGAARKNLRNALWAIRQTLGDGVLQADPHRLALAEGVWVDARAWERLADGPDEALLLDQEALLALHAGPLLDGLAVADAPDFELWLLAERERLEQRFLRTLERLAAALRARGEWAAMGQVARRALALDPLQEAMARAAMEAHARLGERPEALRAFDTLRDTLERELSVAPLPETAALRDAILRGDLPPAPRTTQPRATRAPRPTLPFVGRAAECAALDRELERVRGGEARVVLLSGELGIGKTRLWHEWAARHRAHVTVLEARCLAATQALPFAPLAETLAAPALAERLFAPASPLSPVWLAEVARLLPDLRARLPNLPPPALLPPDEERRRLFEAFAQCLLALPAPLLLFVDDLHWADHATLDWLAWLTHRLADVPLLLVAAYRPEETPAPLARVVAGWSRAGRLRRLALAPLSDADAAALLRALGTDPAQRERAQGQSAGNPYFLTELAQSPADDLPCALVELVRARLERLPEGARQALQAAAILEPAFDPATLRHTAGRDEEETLDALDALLAAGLLREAGDRYHFAHPLVAAIVREALSGARRRFLHRRAAEALEAAHAHRLAEVAGRLAHHRSEAGEPARAAVFAELAADRALALAAPAEAVAFWQQAVALEPTPARRIGLGRALVLWGDLAAARTALEAALAEASAQGDRRAQAWACLQLAEAAMPTGRFDEVARQAERSLAFLEPDDEPEAHALAHFLLGAASLAMEQRLGEAEWHLLEAARLADDHGLKAQAGRSRFELGNLLAERGDLRAAVSAFQEAIALARAGGEPFQEALGHNNAAYHALLAGDLAAARAHVAQGLALAEAQGLRVPLQYLYSTRGELALAEREWDEAETWLRRGLAEAERNGNAKQVANYHANLALAAQGRGELDEALARLDEAASCAAPLPAPHLQTQIDLWLAELHLARGERAAAADALRRASARLPVAERSRLHGWAARVRERVEG